MYTITSNTSNKDFPAGVSTAKEAKAYYLDLFRSGKSFKPKLKLPPIEPVTNVKDKYAIRFDLVGGFKMLAAEKVIAMTKEKVLVYCAPRVGHAAVAIAELANMYNKKAVFFAPSSKEVSQHQAVVLAHGAQLRFVRIAAMPVLNSYAREWAEKNGAKFLPFGLAGVPEVTAGIVDIADRLMERMGQNRGTKKPWEPPEFWCASSTGTMIRGLQIGWPNSRPRSIAVARNMHDGEIGRAEISSSDLTFYQESKFHPDFPTTATYDAKAWKPFLDAGCKNSVFINVGSDGHITERLGKLDLKKIDSYRDWHDHRDLERGL